MSLSLLGHRGYKRPRSHFPTRIHLQGASLGTKTFFRDPHVELHRCLLLSYPNSLQRYLWRFVGPAGHQNTLNNSRWGRGESKSARARRNAGIVVRSSTAPYAELMQGEHRKRCRPNEHEEPEGHRGNEVYQHPIKIFAKYSCARRQVLLFDRCGPRFADDTSI